MITYLGGYSPGSISKGTALLLPQMSALLSAQATAVASLQAQVSAPAVPVPDLSGMLAALSQVQGNLAALLHSLPSAMGSLSASASASLSAGVALQTAAHAAFDLVAAAAASVGGIHLYGYVGNVNSFGPELGTITSGGLPGGGGPSAPAQGVAMVCESPSAWAALGRLVKTT